MKPSDAEPSASHRSKKFSKTFFKSVFDLALCLKEGYSNCVLIISDVGCFLFEVWQTQKDEAGWMSASNALTNVIAWTASFTNRNATFRPGEKGVMAAFAKLEDPARQSGIRSSRSIYLYLQTRQNSRHLFDYTKPT